MKVLIVLVKMAALAGLAVLDAWGPAISEAVKSAILTFLTP